MTSAKLSSNMIKTERSDANTGSLAAHMIKRSRTSLNSRAMDPSKGIVRNPYQALMDKVAAEAREELRYHVEGGIYVTHPDDTRIEPWQKSRKLRGL